MKSKYSFWENFTELCETRNVKPTPLLKSLGVSPGNMKRWQEGATVRIDTVQKIADYFNVSLDYFFKNEAAPTDVETAMNSDEISVMDRSRTIARNYPDYVASVISGSKISHADLRRISAYLRCSVKYLIGMDIEEQDNTPGTAYLTDKELVIDVLSRNAENNSYRYIQVMISRIITDNLKRSCIFQTELIGCGIDREKVTKLYDSTTDSRTILPFTNSDVLRIAHAFKIGYDLIFTGMEVNN